MVALDNAPLELQPCAPSCTLLNFKVSLSGGLHSPFFEHRLPTIGLTILTTSIISKAHILNLIPDLHPHITGRWNREELAEKVVDTSGDDEAAEEIQVVDVLGSLRDLFSDSADESDDIDKDTCDVGSVSSPVDSICEEIRTGLLGGVEILDLEVSLADKVVIDDDYSGDRGEKDRIGRKIGGELVGVLEQIPWTHHEANNGTDVPSSADVEVPGK